MRLSYVLFNYEQSSLNLKVLEEEKIDMEESCDGIGEEECLMRRTLVAHTDYIYTQKHKP